MPPDTLKKSIGSIRTNVQTLVSSVRSKSRKKAILTIAKRRNINRNDALFINSIAIAKRIGRKK